MKVDDIKKRVADLLKSPEFSSHARDELAVQQYASVLSLMVAIYGEGSSQIKSYIRDKDALMNQYGGRATEHISHLAIGTLRNIQAELDSNFLGSLQQSISGEVLTDFISLARHILDQDSSDDAKNVAAVLAAGAFEDMIRRLARLHGIPHMDSLADLINELKNARVLEGSQVTIATSYLAFRNRALHPQWPLVDRASVVSVLGFTEEIILSKF